MKKLLLGFILLFSFSVYCQDRLFRQFETTLGYYNPALNSMQTSFAIQNSLQVLSWGSDSYVGNYFNLGQNFGRVGTFSLNLFTDRQPFSYYQEFSLSYAGVFNLGKNYKLASGIQPAFFTRTIDNSQWITPDGTDPMNDPSISAIEPRKNGFDIHAGLALYSKKLLVSYGVKHLAKPDTDFSSQYMLHNVWVAYKVRKGEGFEFIPSIFGMYQGSFRNVLLNLKFKWRNYFLSIGGQLIDVVNAGIGYQGKVFQVNYGFAINVTGPSFYRYTNHQISLRLNLNLFEKGNESFFVY